MKAVHFILLMFLMAACRQETMGIKGTDSGIPTSEDAYIRTTKIDIETEKPSLRIISPGDGALVKNSSVVVQLKEGEFNIISIGSPVKDNEGHFHVWLDSDRRVTMNRTVAFENVVSGRHSIVAELVKSDHSSLSPKVVQSIIINVESDYAPEPEQKQGGGIREFTVEATDNYFHPNRLKAAIGDKVIIHFKFRDDAIYYAGLDITGPFPMIEYRLKGGQPLTANFTMKEETKISSWWPASRAKKADLVVEVDK